MPNIFHLPVVSIAVLACLSLQLPGQNPSPGQAAAEARRQKMLEDEKVDAAKSKAAYQALTSGNYPLAVKLYTAITSRDPAGWESLRLARAYEHLGRYDEALTTIRNYIKPQPRFFTDAARHPDIQVYFAEMSYLHGSKDEARRAFCAAASASLSNYRNWGIIPDVRADSPLPMLRAYAYANCSAYRDSEFLRPNEINAAKMRTSDAKENLRRAGAVSVIESDRCIELAALAVMLEPKELLPRLAYADALTLSPRWPEAKAQRWLGEQMATGRAKELVHQQRVVHSEIVERVKHEVVGGKAIRTPIEYNPVGHVPTPHVFDPLEPNKAP